MSQSEPKPAFILSIIIALLAAVASAGGLFLDDLYRDNALITSAFRGNDLVTLAIAAPLLIASLIASRRGSARAQLIWMAMLGYMLYNYMFYLFGAAFNEFFMIYVALFSLSVYALIFGLLHIDVAAISTRFNTKAPVKWVASYMLLFAIPWSGMEIARALGFIFTGEVPLDIVQTGHPTGVVYAIDLSLLVPSMVLGGIMLWKRKAWGFVLGTMLMIKGAAYTLALIVMAAFAADFNLSGSWDPLTPFYALLCAGCLIASGLLLGNMQSTEKRDDAVRHTLA